MSSPKVSIVDIIPSPGSFNVARDQIFTFKIESTYQVNPNHTYVVLDNKQAITAGIAGSNFTVIITAISDGYSYSIQPNYLFNDKANFNLEVNATDVFGTPASPLIASYIVIDTRPPLITPILPLDGQVEVPLDLTIHFLVNQLAEPNAGLDGSTLNVSINDNLAVINGVIQQAYTGVYSAINTPPITDIVTPFEVILDYTSRYDAEDIIIVSADIKSIVGPASDTSAQFLNQYGAPALDAYGVILPLFSISNTLKLSDLENRLTLSFTGSNLLADGYISDGYQIKNFNGNKFRVLSILDAYNIVVETNPKILRSKYSFITARFDSLPPTPVFAGYFQGIYFVDNIGDGYHLNAVWHPARTTRPDSDLAYLIYYSATRSDVFYEEPKLITQGRKVVKPETIQGADAQLFGYFAQIPLPVGVTYYFGIRATEYPHSALPIVPADGYGANASGRVVVDGYSFKVPSPQTLLSNVNGSGAIIITVTSTSGHANIGGYITVGAEIMRYTALTGTTFIVPSNGRGLFGSVIQPSHSIGENVKLYYGNYDDNTVIDKNVVLWEPPNDPKRMRPDLVTTDFTLEDGYNTGFQPFDYCGYHRQYPDDLFTAKQCNTYVGGTYDGSVGLYLTERQMAVEEQLLSVTGEPVILMRRLWQGQACICRTSRKDIATVRSCAICFGTGFKGGFIQYNNPREDNTRIMVHFSPNDEDLGMGPQAGWEQKFKPNAWTLNVPSIKDRDLIIRFDHENKNQIQWIYIVNMVSRGETIFGTATRQKLNLSRLDKTDVVYTYKIIK